MTRRLEVLVRFNSWLVHLRRHYIPQMFVFTCGLFGVTIAALFLNVPERFEDAPQLDSVVNMVSPLYWGMLFGALGVIMLTVATVDYTKAVIPALIFGLACFMFSALSAFELLHGPATGLITAGFLFAGGVNWLTVLMATAPITQRHWRESHHG